MPVVLVAQDVWELSLCFAKSCSASTVLSRVAAFMKLVLMQSIAFSSLFSFTIFLLRSEISSASYLRRGRRLVLELLSALRAVPILLALDPPVLPLCISSSSDMYVLCSSSSARRRKALSIVLDKLDIKDSNFYFVLF